MARKLVTKAQGRVLAQNVSAFGPWTKGVNEKNEVFLLNSDELSNASNIILDDNQGIVHKRPGTIFVGQVPFLIEAPKFAYVFKSGSGIEILLVTDNRKVVATEDLINYTNITPTAFLSGGSFVGADANIDFAIAEGLVWFCNGTDPVCSWNGSSAAVVHDTSVVGVTWDNVTDTQVLLADVALDRAGNGTTWVGKKVSCTFAANAGNIGIEREVLTFNDATDSLTFAAYPFTISNGDKFSIGAPIPRGRYVKYHHNTLFLACTPENAEEARFHNNVDPNEPNTTISIGNPNAWPPVNQFVVGSGGDRIWGFTSPVYRNRIGLFKSTGLYRIEPDSTFRFVPVTITEQFGSRFPKSWQQRGDSLVFLGEDTDGKPDVMQTDFVSVRHFNRKHYKTLDNLRQPRTIFKDRIFASQSSWDFGSKSTLTKTENSVLELNALDTQAEWDAAASNTSIDTTAVPGTIRVTGGLELFDDFSDNEYTTNPAWTVLAIGGGTGSISAAGGELAVKAGSVVNAGSGIYAPMNQTDGSWQFRAKSTGDTIGGGFITFYTNSVTFSNGNVTGNGYAIRIAGGFATFIRHSGSNPQSRTTIINIGFVGTGYHTYKITRKDGGIWEAFLDGSSVGTATDANFLGVGFIIIWQPVGQSGSYITTIDQIHIAPYITSGIAASTGTIVTAIDYTRTPDSFGIYYADQALNGGTISYESLSADDAAFTSIDPAGYVPFTIGSTPASQLKRHLRIRITMTTPGAFTSTPVISALYGGSLWTSPIVSVGQNIASWLNLTESHISPVGTSVIIKIRYAITHGTPLEGDFGPFVVISNGQNIGTVIGDISIPPLARWAQVKIEQSTSTGGAQPSVSSTALNWFEGSSSTLPVSSIIYNKKWLVTAASVGSNLNDTIVTLDSNDAFSNWSALKTNLFVWFRNKLYINSGSDILQLTSESLNDDSGPAIGGGRVFSAIRSYLETNQEIGGAISVRKKPRYLDVAMSQSGPTITISSKRDDQSLFLPLLTIPFVAGIKNRRINIPLGFQYHRVIFRVENNEINTDFNLNGMVLIYNTVPAVSGL